MSFNLLASAASSVARLASPIDPIAQQAPASIGHSFDTVALNPQPLPPREGLLLSSRVSALLDDFCDTVPRHLPPPSPPPVGGLLR